MVTANYLNTLTHRKGRGGVELEYELEILKFLRLCLGNKVRATSAVLLTH